MPVLILQDLRGPQASNCESRANTNVYMSAGIKGRSRVGMPGLVITGGKPEPTMRKLGDSWIAAADQDQNSERTFYLYGSLPLDGSGLYMILETVEDAHGGEGGLVGKNWVQNGQIKNFKAAANSYKALRLEACHGSLKSGVPVARLTLEEVKEMVRMLLEKWEKGSSGLSKL